MSEDDIKDNPSLKKLKEEIEQILNFKKYWPVIKPVVMLFGADTVDIEENLIRADALAKQLDEAIVVPDNFNRTFSDIGWIFTESMSLDVAKEAIMIGEREGIEKADEYLSDYYSPDWVEKRIVRLKFIKGFELRYEMAQKALDDYKAGRFYASTLVVLTLIDGWINELNIVNFQRQGFFSEQSQLVAWDSFAAHPSGLMKLKKVFGTQRLATRTETVTIPYRHGIVHGMDLGYDNKFVAAKCWAALFAVREWAIKYAKGELKPPKVQPEKEKTLWESIEDYMKIREKTETLKQWKPRGVIVGETIPAKGELQDYRDGSSEQKIIEFLNYWCKMNYGYMAKCITPMLSMKPADLRESFQNIKIRDYMLISVNESTAMTTDIVAKVEKITNEEVSYSQYEFRLICTTRGGEVAYIESDDTVWGIANWRLIE